MGIVCIAAGLTDGSRDEPENTNAIIKDKTFYFFIQLLKSLVSRTSSPAGEPAARLLRGKSSERILNNKLS